jgi:hypothetical protein
MEGSLGPEQLLSVALAMDPFVRHADVLQGVEDGFEEARLGLLALLLGSQAVEPRDAGAAGEDLDGRGIGDERVDLNYLLFAVLAEGLASNDAAMQRRFRALCPGGILIEVERSATSTEATSS